MGGGGGVGASYLNIERGWGLWRLYNQCYQHFSEKHVSIAVAIPGLITGPSDSKLNNFSHFRLSGLRSLFLIELSLLPSRVFWIFWQDIV